MKHDSSELEQLIGQMSLKQPSADLDQRVAKTAQAHGEPGAPVLSAVVQGRNQPNWNLPIFTSALSLLIGIALGWLITNYMQFTGADMTERRSPDEQTTFDVGIIPVRNGQAILESQAEDGAEEKQPQEVQTRIVKEQLLRMPDGELKKVYQTVTPRDYWFYDEEAEELRPLRVSIPRTIVTQPPRI